VIPILDSRGMRGADAEAIRRGADPDDLMENAAEALRLDLRGAWPGARRIVVVCGPGKNGGDGLAAARLLALEGASPAVFTLRDPSLYTGEAAANARRARAVGLTPTSLGGASGHAALRRALADGDAVIDALFGTGLSRALEGGARRAVALINASGRCVLAADLPSGLSADRGRLFGAAVRATRTVTFAAPKLCHVLAPASGLCGEMTVADIGIARAILARRARRLWMTEAADAAARLPARPRDSHKGDFGRLAILAGSRGKPGAAILSARGALRGGAGLVTVFCAESIATGIASALPEAMAEALPEASGALDRSAADGLARAWSAFDAAVAGPGLGTSAQTVAALEEVLHATRIPLVADADALNAFAGRPRFFARRRAPTVLTPHPGEAGRLLGRSSRAVQADRLGAVRALARASRSIVVLKGAHTLIGGPDGEVIVNPTGTPLLATAGSGDVLSGVIGALLAGGLSARDAAIAGVYLHGAAAQALEPRLGDAGLLAHEVADAIPRVRRAVRAALDRRHG
jgi:ADP-dependent NAD(P)H-hydrate dehydratase / NAD(P)H-hydrate epimerase